MKHELAEHYRVTPEQAAFFRRRVRPFLNREGTQKSLEDLLAEVYAQGLADAVTVAMENQV